MGDYQHQETDPDENIHNGGEHHAEMKVRERNDVDLHRTDLAMPFSISLWVNPAATQVEHGDILFAKTNEGAFREICTYRCGEPVVCSRRWPSCCH
ncbi:MAG: hypothetical protein HQ592_10325 [Planctomycetes bacterium]|nr:hypothetical protein [Planctomycetota bacterium]